MNASLKKLCVAGAFAVALFAGSMSANAASYYHDSRACDRVPYRPVVFRSNVNYRVAEHRWDNFRYDNCWPTTHHITPYVNRVGAYNHAYRW